MFVVSLWIAGCVALLVFPSLSQGSNCCSQTKFYMCRKACLKLKKSGPGFTKVNLLLQHCPSYQNSFWKCINSTLTERKSFRSQYFHGICCPLAATTKCSTACHSLAEKDSILKFCSAKQDLTLQRCINKVEMFESCCSATQKAECRNACYKVIKSKDAPSFHLISSLHHMCQESPALLNCIASLTGHADIVSVHNYSRCCKEGKSEECRRKCTLAFSRNIDESNMVGLLIQDCGQPMPQVGLYQCLFEAISQKAKYEDKSMRENIRDPNVFRSQCCSRAVSLACKNWCKTVFSKMLNVDHTDPLYTQCMENPAEYGFSTCIEDVLEPCKYGCKDKLTFCSNFNNRPLELFRRCDRKADKAAREIYNSWKSGQLSFLSVKLKLKNITLCSPAVWKALACTMVIKPCSRKSNRNQICRSDCVSLLSRCVDFADRNARSAGELCMMLLPNSEQSDCISTANYLSAKHHVLADKVEFPCQNNPCKSGEICSLHGVCSEENPEPNCRKYKCLPGCSIGSAKNIKIHNEDLAKVPLASEKGECYGICQCLPAKDNFLDAFALRNCVEFGCNRRMPCKVNGKQKGHKTTFTVGCNFCTCFDGEMICTNRICHPVQSSLKKFRCQCFAAFKPTCGFNGLTYPSLCHARCAGLADEDLQPGDCGSIDPCYPNPCPVTMTCLSHRRVCLLPNFICPQYDCIPSQDSKNGESLFGSTNESLPCRKLKTPSFCGKERCKESVDIRPVCGLDGVTYEDSCDAARQMVPIDFAGPCSSISDQKVVNNRCEGVQCPDLMPRNCSAHTPLHACCPICEPLLRILYSTRELNRHLQIVSPKPLAVKDVMRQLSYHISAKGCSLRGYLSLVGDIIVIIKSDVYNAGQIQREICKREAEKLAGMINQQSPLLTANYHLSVAKAASLQYPSFHKSSGGIRTSQLWILTLTIVLVASSFM